MNILNTQADFDKMLGMLSKEAVTNGFVQELVNYSICNEVVFSTPVYNGSANIPSKQHWIGIYKDKADMEKYLRPDSPFVLGYDMLLPALYSTDIEEVCISSIHTDIGAFIVFSDFGFNRFIGILKSKRTLSEIREKYLQHKKQVEAMGAKVLYEYSEEGMVFRNGKLVE